ncbi:uncharacterized protein LOC141655938 [Silene latifolia]|uniref:uncharacterized protein LOC141655938 n=1 Tax=Silene latifolia TaxID=37657 RepID=UPI003D76A5BB
MVVIERASSLSSLSSTRKTEKGRSFEKDTNNTHEIVKLKSVKRASSFSSIRKEKQIMTSSSPKHGQERLKSKLMPRASSFSSLPSPLKKEKLIRGGSSLSTSNVESPKRARKSLTGKVKSKIKELGPICKKRKEVLTSIQVDDEFEVCFDKQINEGTMINPDDCFWLSSGSMSPQEFGLFMSALDPCLDEWVISFVPQSSNSPSVVKHEVVTSGETLVEEPVKHVVINEDPACSSSLALSTYTNNSAFWNMDRTGVWVSLINLEGENSNLISDEISEDEELDSNFPSPTHQEINWDAYSSDVGISSSARSTQESSHSDWSSDLLSDSLDWDLDSEDPIFWPFGLESGWDPNLESFSVSPRKGTYKTDLDSENDGVGVGVGVVSPNSIKFRLHASRDGNKDGFKKKILFVSGLSASKIIEFKKGYRKKIASSRRSQIGKRVGRFKRRVPPPILETDLEGISPKETPTKETQEELVSFASDMMSGSEDWADEMDSDGPLVWPNDQRTDWNWNVTCDFLNISPRKNVVNITNFGSPKGGFTVSGSIRLKFRSNKKSKTKSSYTLPGLGASKNFKFKPESHRRGKKTTPLRLSPSCKSLVVIVPPKRISSFKPTGYNNGITRITANNGKRIRSMPIQMGRSAEEYIRMLSAGSVNRKFPKAVLTSEKNPIETAMGLSEFDGHEGVDMDFEEGNFSFEEFRNG